MKKIVSIICMITILAFMTSPVYAAKKDTKAPTVSKTDPAGNTSDIMIESNIIIRFSENIQKGKNFSKIIIKELETKDIAYTCEIVDNLLKITPKEDLKYNTLYTITVPLAAVKDKSGNSLKTDYTFKFMSEEDPSKIADLQDKEESIKYILELEANMDHELKMDDLIYFEQLMKMFGIDATFTDYYKAEDKDALADGAKPSN